MNEISKQFEEIYAKHNDPEEKAKIKLLKDREKRAKKIKEDLGL